MYETTMMSMERVERDNPNNKQRGTIIEEVG
jgi:hypothetical protein